MREGVWLQQSWKKACVCNSLDNSVWRGMATTVMEEGVWLQQSDEGNAQTGVGQSLNKIGCEMEEERLCVTVS
jgi:hypothetical protein